MPSSTRVRRSPRATHLSGRIARLLAGAAAAALMLTVAPALTSSAAADESQLPPGRTLVPYTVQPGDTATGLAVEHRAYTRELIAHNKLGPSGNLRVGQKIMIPVVDAAVGKKPATTKESKPTSSAKSSDPTRAEVRRVIIRTAEAHGVDPHLALAISWQEAGWKMHHVSSADAIGAMQVLPGTGEWMELYAKKPLNLRDLGDNVLAGVLLLKVLEQHTDSLDEQIAAYYQGLGAVQRHGIYQVSKPYVANVKALRDRLKAGWNPA